MAHEGVEGALPPRIESKRSERYFAKQSIKCKTLKQNLFTDTRQRGDDEHGKRKI